MMRTKVAHAVLEQALFGLLEGSVVIRSGCRQQPLSRHA
jgi:hypothetical protein